jgi:hypothetical protein
MSDITLNGERVISGTITFPYYGPWVADVILATATDIVPAVTLIVGDLTLSGTVVRQASFTSSRSARIVGGGGGWRKTLPARGYSHEAGVKLSSVLGDAARESGERIMVASDRTIGKHYARDIGKAERVLAFELGGQWWVDPQGVTQIVARSAAPIVTPFNVIAWSGGKGLFEIASEYLTSWQPGRTFTSPTVPTVQTIASVTIEVDNAGKLRLHVLNTDGGIDRLRTNLRALTRSERPSIIGVWEYTVIAGTSETVDISPDDTRMPSLSNVPMMPGLMGEVVTPTPGSKCRITFVNSDPTRPECIGIIGTPVLSKLSGGILGAARMTDAIQAGPFSGTIIGGSTKVLVG